MRPLCIGRESVERGEIARRHPADPPDAAAPSPLSLFTPPFLSLSLPLHAPLVAEEEDDDDDGGGTRGLSIHASATLQFSL